MKLAILGAAVSVTLMPLGALAQDQSVESFYSGNTVTIAIGYTVGGSFDAYARLLARHIGEYLPGNPDVIVENIPGAGSLTLTNHMANVAPRDGSYFGVVGRGIPVEPLLGATDVQYDVEALNWIGSMSDDMALCVVHERVDLDDWSDVIEGNAEVVLGGNGPAADNELFPRMQVNLFGANIRIISGYPGQAEVALAVETGELDGYCGSLSQFRQAGLIETGVMKPMVQISTQSAEGLEDVPLVIDYAETDDERQILNMILSRLEIARPFVAPPELPADRLAALREAFMAAANDPDLIAEAEAQGLTMNPMDGAAVEQRISEIYATPDNVVEMTREALAVE